DSTAASITCTVPSHRLDVHKEIDLVEEVARLAGYDRLPVREHLTVTVRREQVQVTAWALMREMLNAHGYHETINFSFVQPVHGQPFVPHDAQA
ncbi:MAG: phenylalanine--tRNA ligase subunit beta, partial [Phycisphaerales bacterium]|nr:phenylalanine--tRNA ligase subunit beta [Phycisphaerales bacterium]